ncbi:radical SAM protein [Ruminococcus sp.]|uniref:radical SAM protein n=1 Tax=Ruminococcus sp. TaxID=41978 RepID=UPI00388F6E75
MAVSNYKILKSVYSDLNEFKDRYRNHNGYYPLDAEIRVSWRCNARCKMCGLHRYVADKDNGEFTMDVDTIYRLVKELADMGCKSITFSGGEPTLLGELPKIIKTASEDYRMCTSINTNGYLLNEERIREYIDAGIDSFTISVLSPDEHINDEIMGLKNGLSTTMKAIDYINEYSKSIYRDVKVYINNVILKDNIESLAGYTEFCKEHKITHLNLSPASIETEWDEWTCSDEELRPTVGQVRKLKSTIQNVLQMKDCNIFVGDPFGDSDDEITKNLHVIFSNIQDECFVAYLHTVIQFNGDVIPCCYAPEDFIMGNILKNSFKDIWDSEKYRMFRKNCTDVKWDMCKSCRQYARLNASISKKMVESK